MKNIGITIGGAGYEIVQSEFTDDELDKLDDWCEENNETREGAFIYNLEDIFEDKGPWYDCDGLGHYYGASLSGKIYLEDKDKEWELEITDVEHDTEEVNNTISVTGTTVCCVSWEKGTILEGEFELEDEEEFDETKLKLEVKEIMTPNSLYEVITGFSYDGKEIPNDGPSDTSGKGFDVEID